MTVQNCTINDNIDNFRAASYHFRHFPWKTALFNTFFSRLSIFFYIVKALVVDICVYIYYC